MSEVKLSNIVIEDAELQRMEAEYFQNKYLELQKRLEKNKSIGEFSKQITCGPFGSNLLDTLYSKEGVLVVRPFNLKNSKIEDDNLVFINEKDIKQNGLKLFSKNTLLFSRVGDIKIGVQTFDRATISPNIIAVEFENQNLSKALVFFFQTYYGYLQIERQLKISAQPTISTGIIYNLKVPNLTNKFIDLLANIFDRTIEIDKQSKSLYTAAENILLDELGLSQWQPTIKNNNTKTLKESFLATGRIDAEYYQPKYDEMLNKVCHIDNDILGNLVTIQKSIEPGSEAYQNEGIPFIRVADLSKNGLSDSSVFLSPAEFGDYPYMPKANTILLSKDGSVGIAYKLEADVVGITSSAILHLTVHREDILPDYLCLVINSIIVKLQAERDAGGSIIQHWKPDEIKQVIIPILSNVTQLSISEKVQESFALQKQSKQLLDLAKQAVEIAIEQNEDVAINYIKNQLNRKNG